MPEPIGSAASFRQRGWCFIAADRPSVAAVQQAASELIFRLTGGPARVEAGSVTPFSESRALSQSHESLPPHTDGYYFDPPPDLVVMGMVRAAAEGGETILVPIDTLTERL